jgi:ribosomal protein L44E
MLMDKLDSCPYCHKQTEITVEGVLRKPDGSSMSWGTCPECSREVPVAFEAAPNAHERAKQKDAEWLEERRKSGAPILKGVDRQQGGCPHCGEWVEVQVEEISTNEDGHRLSWGRCPKCDEDIVSILTELGLTWFAGRATV